MTFRVLPERSPGPCFFGGVFRAPPDRYGEGDLASNPSAELERSFKRDVDELPAIVGFIEELVHGQKLTEEIAYTLNLVAEELFTNMVKYSPKGDRHIVVKLRLTAEQITMSLIDSGVLRFDPRETTPRDLDKAPQERRPGGLGVHLVKELVDEFHYDYVDGSSIITIIKRLR